MSTGARCFALLPAAGSGSRFGAGVPKQYLPLAGIPLLQRTLAVMLGCPQIERVYVVLAPDDPWYDARVAALPRVVPLRVGGATRAESVRNGLAAIAAEVGPDDWVLVHDAARPLLTPADVARLCETLAEDPVGGLLACPLADTLKRAGTDQRIAATIPREGLWQAQTPQMFRRALLSRALAAEDAVTATDEAQAVERLGLQPRLVPGSSRNFKITYPGDFALAEHLLQS